MIAIDTSDAERDLRRYFEELSPQKTRLAVSRAINETLTTGRAQLVREIANIYTIKPSLAKQQLTNIKANSNVLSGSIRGVTRRHSMSDFKNSKYDAGTNSMQSIRTFMDKSKGRWNKQFATRQLRGKSMRIKDKKKYTRLLIEIKKGQQKGIPSAFMMQSNGGIIWAGRGKYNSAFNFDWRDKRVSQTGNDLPVNKLLTPSIYVMAINNTVLSRTAPTMTERYMKRLEHNLMVGLTHKGKYV